MTTDSSTRFAVRSIGAIFAAATAFFGWAFVYELHKRHEIRTGLFTYGLFTLMAAVGLLQVRAWGRSIGLVIAVGSAGLGILTLMGTIFGNGGPVLKPAILLIISVVVSVVLSRSIFVLPDEKLSAPRSDEE